MLSMHSRMSAYLYKIKKIIILPSILVFLLEHYVFEIQILKPLAFGFIVFYIAYSFKFLNNFGKFGDFTYGIYIYHFPIIQIFTFILKYIQAYIYIYIYILV